MRRRGHYKLNLQGSFLKRTSYSITSAVSFNGRWNRMFATVNIFISWSGERSRAIAQSLREWLPYVLPNAKPWMSAADIDRGSRWSSEISQELDRANVGIICLTPDNLEAPWVLFEAGALSKALKHTLVCTYLFNVRPSIPNPVPLNTDQRLLSNAMVRYWTQFARNGNPNSADTPFWPAYSSTTDQRQSLTPVTPFTQSTFAVDHHCAFWAPGT